MHPFDVPFKTNSWSLPKPGIKLSCDLCGWNNHQGAYLEAIFCDFVSAEGNIGDKPRRLRVCQRCRLRPLACEEHQQLHVIFIDLSHTCPQCVRVEARLRLKNRRDSLHHLFHEVMRNYSHLEKRKFYTLVRSAIDDAGGKKTSPLMCFIVAMVAKSRSWQISFDEILVNLNNQGTLLALLPQDSRKYKMEGNPG